LRVTSQSAGPGMSPSVASMSGYSLTGVEFLA